MRKTATDIQREDIAHEINGRLIGTGVSVVAGGDKGPYTIVVNRLNREDVNRVLAAVLEIARPSYRCLRCGIVSHHPEDAARRYCAACLRWNGTDEV